MRSRQTSFKSPCEPMTRVKSAKKFPLRCKEHHELLHSTEDVIEHFVQKHGIPIGD